MGKVLIAYNDDASENSRQFFDGCATDIRNYCIGKSFDYEFTDSSKFNGGSIHGYGSGFPYLLCG